MSVRFREWANSPSPEFPECATRSISLNPGEFTSHLSLFTGMGCCNREPGLVRPYLRRFRSARSCSPSGAGRFAVRSCPTAVSLSPGASGSLPMQGIQPGNKAFSRTDQGYPAASQIRGQDGEHWPAIARPSSSWPPPRWLPRSRSVHKTNRIFPVVSGVPAKFVQHHSFGFAPSFAVALVNGSEIFPLRLVPQSTLIKIVFESGYILCVSTAPPLVTFSMARLTRLTRRENPVKIPHRLTSARHLCFPCAS